MSLFSLLLAFALTQTPAPQPAQGAPLTVMSFNIRYGTANDGDNHWLKRREQLFALLREQQADVVGLQEALHGQIEEILQRRARLRRTSAWAAATDAQAGEHAAILYRTARLQRAAQRHVLVLGHAGRREVHVVGQPDRAHLHVGLLRGPRRSGLLRVQRAPRPSVAAVARAQRGAAARAGSGPATRRRRRS
ncbi:MAG: hypothetical protein M0C28_23310 [Candidatus Moduliflexus flocculans]|nr:hypothetical protein [Candidatus Moduliflexus flocculans]